MEMCITGHSADGKHHSKHMEKHRAFPHPLNNVSHSSVTRPVIHSSTMPAATDHPSSYIPVYHKKKKEQKNRKRHIMSQNRKTGSTANGLPVKTMLPYFLSVTEAVKRQNQPFLGVFFAALL